MSSKDPDRLDAPPNRRATIAALIAVVVLVGSLLWIAQAIMAHNRLQNCIDSGRHDCLPAEQGGQG
ncbi:MAG: hypothetical protein INR64_12895 [Caulobacteraceae bacterium]|nr:hypothetical protein [Caulobacter sp.]